MNRILALNNLQWLVCHINQLTHHHRDAHGVMVIELGNSELSSNSEHSSNSHRKVQLYTLQLSVNCGQSGLFNNGMRTVQGKKI